MMKVLVRINQLVPFQMDTYQIRDWAISIERIDSTIEPRGVAFLIDKFITEEVSFDKSKGIQNIFAGLKRIEKADDGSYQLKTTHKYTW